MSCLVVLCLSSHYRIVLLPHYELVPPPTSVGYVQTVLAVVLTVMSGMDPHMIRWNPGLGVGLVWLISASQSCWLGQSSAMDSMV
jgi:hypothetical protein